MSIHTRIQDSLEQHKQQFLDELFDFLRIPSVSAQEQHAPDMQRAADWLVVRLKELGCSTELIATPGYPVVYAERHVSDDAPTILMYGHYDVQPPEPLELWQTEPFEPTIRPLEGQDKIFARGACDDKGQLYMHIKALHILKQLDALACNVKFFIEGEEEVGSEHLVDTIKDNLERLACDVVLIHDTAMIAVDTPSITVGVRGMAYMEVEVTGPNRDLHSGEYGGAVDNPVNVLADIISQLKSPDKRITIPGFYDDVAELPAEAREALKQIPWDEASYKKKLDLQALAHEAGYSPLEGATIRPTLDVNGIWGGYTGQGAKTVLPSKATAKISMRLVPNQTEEKIEKLFADYVKSLAPATVKVEVRSLHGGPPAVVSTGSTAYQAAEEAIIETIGKKPIPARSGGSIPVVAAFDQLLQVPVILMGFGLDTDAIHSPNESFGLWNYFKGIETIALYHHKLAARK